MNQRELRELIEFLIEKGVAEFEMERGDLKVRIVREHQPAAPAAAPPLDLQRLTQVLGSQPAPAPAAPAPVTAAQPIVPPAQAAPPAADEAADLHIVKSPIVGTFYESPSPGAPAFVKVGDTVGTGQILCIIEAMKLMNEIESDASGEIVKRFVTNGQPVEYGQSLFAIRPKK